MWSGNATLRLRPTTNPHHKKHGAKIAIQLKYSTLPSPNGFIRVYRGEGHKVLAHMHVCTHACTNNIMPAYAHACKCFASHQVSWVVLLGVTPPPPPQKKVSTQSHTTQTKPWHLKKTQNDIGNER